MVFEGGADVAGEGEDEDQVEDHVHLLQKIAGGLVLADQVGDGQDAEPDGLEALAELISQPESGIASIRP